MTQLKPVTRKLEQYMDPLDPFLTEEDILNFYCLWTKKIGRNVDPGSTNNLLVPKEMIWYLLVPKGMILTQDYVFGVYHVWNYNS